MAVPSSSFSYLALLSIASPVSVEQYNDTVKAVGLALSAAPGFGASAPRIVSFTGERPAKADALLLRANFSWTLLGNIVYAACQWGILIALAKLGNPTLVGQFALGLGIAAPLFLFTNLQLRGIQATDAGGEFQFGDYLALRVATTVVALFGLIVIVTTAGYGRQTALVVLMVGVAKGVEALSDVVYGLLQQQERLDRVAKSMLLKGTLSLAAASAAVYLTGSILWAATALAVAWSTVLIAYDLPSGAAVLASSVGNTHKARFRPRWDKRTLTCLAMLALPLGLTMMLISLNTNIPRYFLEHYLGERSLGIFAAAAYVITAGTTVIGALGQSSSPRLAKCYAAGQAAAFRSLVLRLVAIGSGLGAVGVLIALAAGRELLTLLYTPEYAEHTGVLALLMVAAGLGYIASFLGYAVTAARLFRSQLPLAAAVAGTTVVACACLIPRYGLRGAAWSLVISATVNAAGSLVLFSNVLRRGLGPKHA